MSRYTQNLINFTRELQTSQDYEAAVRKYPLNDEEQKLLIEIGNNPQLAQEFMLYSQAAPREQFIVASQELPSRVQYAVASEEPPFCKQCEDNKRRAINAEGRAAAAEERAAKAEYRAKLAEYETAQAKSRESSARREADEAIAAQRRAAADATAEQQRATRAAALAAENAFGNNAALPPQQRASQARAFGNQAFGPVSQGAFTNNTLPDNAFLGLKPQ